MEFDDFGPVQGNRLACRAAQYPADVFYGLAAEKDTARRNVLADARARHRHRFARDTEPKFIDLPETASINPPTPTEQEPPATAA